MILEQLVGMGVNPPYLSLRGIFFDNEIMYVSSLGLSSLSI